MALQGLFVKKFFALFFFSPLFLFGNLKAISFHEQTIQIDDAQVYCRSLGSGSPLIIVHGGPGLSQEYLINELSPLTKNHFVIFYDPRNSGKSTAKEDLSDLTLEVSSEDIEAIRKFYGLKKVSLLGHSWGALVAAKYAINHPSTVDRLALISPVPFNSAGFTLFMEEWAMRIGPHFEKIEEITRNPLFAQGDPKLFSDYSTLIYKFYCAHEDDAYKINTLDSPAANIKYRQTEQLFEDRLFKTDFDFLPEISHLSCKTMIVHGDVDIIPLETAKTTHEAIPDSLLLVIDDCGHFPFVEKQEAFFEAVGCFLD